MLNSKHMDSLYPRIERDIYTSMFIAALFRRAKKRKQPGAALVAQWLRICPPMQATRVRALAWKDPTCCGATKPMCHNY